MHFVREIRFACEMCCGAWGDLFHFTLRLSGAIFHNFRKKINSHSATPNISLNSRVAFLYYEPKTERSPIGLRFCFGSSLLYLSLRHLAHAKREQGKIFPQGKFSARRSPSMLLWFESSRGSQKKALAKASAFFNEIRLRRVKYGFAMWNSFAVKYLLCKCEKANFISHRTKWIFHNVRQHIISHSPQVNISLKS